MDKKGVVEGRDREETLSEPSFHCLTALMSDRVLR